MRRRASGLQQRRWTCTSKSSCSTSPSATTRWWCWSIRKSSKPRASPTSKKAASRCPACTTSWSAPSASRYVRTTRTAIRSRSRRKACLPCASSTRWITSRARSSSSTCRSSSSSACAPSWPSSCASPPNAFLRLVFAGTPEFAERALAALLDAGHEVSQVLTQPDRPAGRGMRPVASAVKQLALSRGLELFQPESLKDGVAQARIAGARADCLVVAAYGLILPPPVLRLAPHGALNIHASLLPRWRGAAPIQRALLAGDLVSGVSIIQMDAGLDTGPVLLSEPVGIAPEETGGTLHDKLASLGARLIVTALEALSRGAAEPTAQPAEGVTYAHKIDKAEARIDWRRGAVEIERQIRAFNPFPGALARL